MSERPTKQEVDLALLISQLDSPTASNAAKLLALEVRALREELASENSEARRIFTKEFQDELLERTQECDRLRATIARIEACVSSAEQRPATWSFRDFVEWLRAALKGEP